MAGRFDMCECAKLRRALLEEHVGKDVTVILNTSQNNVFQGILGKHQFSAFDEECWVVTSERGLMQRGPNQTVAVPETKSHFFAEDLKCIVVPQETQAEAAKALEGEKLAMSLASPGWDNRQ